MLYGQLRNANVVEPTVFLDGSRVCQRKNILTGVNDGAQPNLFVLIAPLASVLTKKLAPIFIIAMNLVSHLNFQRSQFVLERRLYRETKVNSVI